MVDIANQLMGIISWFINQLITGGAHPVNISVLIATWDVTYNVIPPSDVNISL